MKNINLLLLSLSWFILMGCTQQNNNPSQILFLNHNENANGNIVTLNTINPSDWNTSVLLQLSHTEYIGSGDPLYQVFSSLSVSPNLGYVAWITYSDGPLPNHGELSLLNIENQEEIYIDTRGIASIENQEGIYIDTITAFWGTSEIYWSPDSTHIAYCAYHEGGAREVMLFNIETNNSISTGIYDTSCVLLAWDYIGEHLAIPLGDNRVIIYNAREQKISDTIDISPVAYGTHTVICNPQWSPDSQYLVFRHGCAMRGIGHLDGYEIFLYSLEEQTLTSVVDFSEEEMQTLIPLVPHFEYDWLVQDGDLFLVIMFKCTVATNIECGNEVPKAFVLIYDVKTQTQRQYISEVVGYRGRPFALSSNGILLWETLEGWQTGKINRTELEILPNMISPLPSECREPKWEPSWEPSGNYIAFINCNMTPEYIYDYEEQKLLNWSELIEGKSLFLGWVGFEGSTSESQ
jgi:hypothetical protein